MRLDLGPMQSGLGIFARNVLQYALGYPQPARSEKKIQTTWPLPAETRDHFADLF